jgi:hypothetical protein
LSSHGNEVFVNPDQVLYVRTVGLRHKKTAFVLTYRKRLMVDQDTETVRDRFEDYLRDVVHGDDDGAPGTREGESSRIIEN